jgi:flagellar motor switch protein FliM
MADEILSQQEIEALLSTLVQSGQVSQSTKLSQLEKHKPVREPKKPAALSYEIYDFRRPDKLSKEQLRTLQMLHETFARLAGTGLSAYFRSAISMELISLEQVPYEEYLRGVSHSVFLITSLSPLSGQCVFEMDFDVLFAMIDRMLGGPGRLIERNILTDIERPLARQTFERIYSAFKTAWENVIIISPSVEGIETSAQFVQVAPPTDIVVTMLFEIKMGDVRGAMSICIPYLVLKSVSGKLSAQKWFVSGGRKQSISNRRAITGQVTRTPVECSVLLGKAQMSVMDFLKLKKDDVIKLDRSSNGTLPLCISKVPKYLGRPALSGKRLAFHITGISDSN